MVTNILDYLEGSAARCPDKLAFVSDDASYTFAQLLACSQAIGSKLASYGAMKNPVVVLMDKSANCVPAFMGALQAGCFFVPVDTKMPQDRMMRIIAKLQPIAVIHDDKNAQKAADIAGDAVAVSFAEIVQTPIDASALQAIRRNVIDTDLLYVLFTSGSTGEPKGVTISHKCAIEYTEFLNMKLDIDETCVFGNQTPFHFDVSGFDMYSSLKNGATTYFIPQKCFMFAKLMVAYLNEHKINTICWVPFALCTLANSGILEKTLPEHLKYIFFGGEVMPTKQLNMVRAALPNARYCNLYGPTETTIYSAYYVLERQFQDDEPLPIGFACENTRIILLDDDNKEPKQGDVGELCILGSSLSFGYYKDKERTDAAFMQNPLNDAYSEMMYRTGDLVKYNEYGELMYLTRKDFQIKHKGYRIELGEIETALNATEGVLASCCVYDDANQKIVAFYTGAEQDKALRKALAQKVPSYMIPEKYINLQVMPQNANGKIDRLALKKEHLG